MILTKTFTATGKNGTFTGRVQLEITECYRPRVKTNVGPHFVITTKVDGFDSIQSSVSLSQEKYVEGELKQSEKWLLSILNELASKEDTTKALVARMKELGYK